ncbi:MAG: serine/threonine-protein kinase, partial [Kofleriaceae bacterium]
MPEPPPDRTATLHRGAEAETVEARPSGARVAAQATLGKYTLERVLGTGGMGIVWCARDPDLERSVAIKLLHAQAAGPEQRQRLLREARAMARLKHPNVLTVYEVDSDGDRDYIAMELVDGANLDTWLSAKPPAADVWSAVIAAGRGLAAAHAAGLVHRDFKPHNVLRSVDGRVLVTDFGLARGTGEAGARVPVELPTEPVALADTMDA